MTNRAARSGGEPEVELPSPEADAAAVIRWAPAPDRFRRARGPEPVLRIYDPAVDAAARAYWRELADPDSPASDLEPTIRALTAKAEATMMSAGELMRMVRTQRPAAEFGPVPARGRRSATRERPCEKTPIRLAALAAGELAPDERRLLDDHVEECLPCQALVLKTLRAERVMATMLAGSAAAEPIVDAAPDLVAARSTGAGAEAPDPATNGGRPVAKQVDAGALEAAVHAYCRELYDLETRPATAAAIIEALAGHPPGSAHAGPDEMLRRTRSLAAKRAATGTDHSHSRRQSSGSPCRRTLELLATRAAGELAPEQRRDLELHLSACLLCQTTALKARRAERAFATMLGATLAWGPSEEEIVPSAATVAPAQLSASPGRPATARLFDVARAATPMGRRSRARRRGSRSRRQG